MYPCASSGVEPGASSGAGHARRMQERYWASAFDGSHDGCEGSQAWRDQSSFSHPERRSGSAGAENSLEPGHRNVQLACCTPKPTRRRESMVQDVYCFVDSPGYLRARCLFPLTLEPETAITAERGGWSSCCCFCTCNLRSWRLATLLPPGFEAASQPLTRQSNGDCAPQWYVDTNLQRKAWTGDDGVQWSGSPQPQPDADRSTLARLGNTP